MYLEIDEGFLGHRKTLRFCSLMQNPEASVFLMRLWTWACRSAPSGSLSGMEAYDIEIAVAYRNLDGKCYAAMVSAGFIDEVDGRANEIHGWTERTGAAIAKMTDRAKYLKQWRDDRRSGSDRRTGQPKNSIETVSEQFADKVEALTKQPSPVQSSQDQTRQEEDPPTPASGGGEPVYSEAFEALWEDFPKRRGTKFAAWKTWNRLKPKPVPEAVAAGIRAWNTSHDWTKDGGEYIPAMSAWLNARAWETQPGKRAPPPSPPRNVITAPQNWPKAPSL